MTQKMENDLIIVPDVHGRGFWRDAVERHPDGRFLFLGDYLDPYGDEGITTEEAFRGLEDIVRLKEEHPDRVTLLWGNHDLHYLYPELLGSRYDFDHAERNGHFFQDHQTLFAIAHETEAAGRRFLFSHAGVGMGWLRHNFPGILGEDVCAGLLNDLVGYPPFMKALGDVSHYRWGDKRWGSMVWADIHEAVEEENRIPGVVQVFGHTQLRRPLNVEDRVYCLDCRRCFRLDLREGLIHDLLTGEPVGAADLT